MERTSRTQETNERGPESAHQWQEISHSAEKLIDYYNMETAELEEELKERTSNTAQQPDELFIWMLQDTLKSRKENYLGFDNILLEFAEIHTPPTQSEIPWPAEVRVYKLIEGNDAYPAYNLQIELIHMLPSHWDADTKIKILINTQTQEMAGIYEEQGSSSEMQNMKLLSISQTVLNVSLNQIEYRRQESGVSLIE